MALQTFQQRVPVAGLVGVCLLTGLAMPRHVAAAQRATVSAAQGQAISEQPEGTSQFWAEAAIRTELKIIDTDGKVSLRYRQRKVDEKGDTTREIIESKEDNVARLAERNGQPITTVEDAAERAPDDEHYLA